MTSSSPAYPADTPPPDHRGVTVVYQRRVRSALVYKAFLPGPVALGALRVLSEVPPDTPVEPRAPAAAPHAVVLLGQRGKGTADLGISDRRNQYPRPFWDAALRAS